MKNKKMSLRIKLTFTSIVILTSMCILLTMTAIYSASVITNSINSLLPGDSQYIQEPTNSYAAASTTQSTEAATKTFRINNITVMFILIVAGSYMTYYFSSKALKPLEKLNDEINKININNLNVNIELQNTGNEIDQLTQSFNTMTSKLHNSYILQKNFSANAAHELRTPLAVIQTKIDVFKMKKRSMEEYDEFLATIEENTVRLSGIVKGLLNFTNEQVVDMSQQVNIKEIVEEVLYELEDEAIRNNIDISLKGNNTVVNGNDGLLQQAIYNLIENAIKYNNKDGKIEVEILQKDNTIILRVSDTGIGIPDEMKERIFQPLFRVDESRSRDIAGSGLGLTIVKNIIEKHGGIIRVKDNIPQGTCFEVIFKNLK
ncbi:HAMP domain-containing histidine kinase [Clostridium sp. NSJ-6]|uniref:histidine kinase n=1 Tax=Clostridium hominis TaxID=2763036 RepID=A0ABR7DC85_9CLOT|nr:HAMP domain-containing sensor histidine kinase [Clostridium hominis]MBC5628797.1 HAMP domain-containing histidine kinase [Clostridium hominis]